MQEEAKLIRHQKHKGELLTIQDIKNMNYTSKVGWEKAPRTSFNCNDTDFHTISGLQVAEELIRLANISPFIFRRVVKDDVVLNGELLKVLHSLSSLRFTGQPSCYQMILSLVVLQHAWGLLI